VGPQHCVEHHPSLVRERWKHHGHHEIDLSDRNANRLRNSFAEFVGHALKVGVGRVRKLPTSAGADKSQTGAMREWLRKHGYEVSDRGRIPA
jgi:hypothetical protein